MGTKKEIITKFNYYFPDVKIKVALIGGQLHIGVVSAPEAIVCGAADKYIFNTRDFANKGTLFNNGCELTQRGWDIYNYLRQLTEDYDGGKPTYLYLGMPSRTGFEAFK